MSLLLHRIGVYLRPRNAFTRNQLGELVKESYKATFPTELRHVYNVANIRDLMAPCMFAIPHVTKPQAFRISRDPTDNMTKMQVQRRSYEDKWGAVDKCVLFYYHYVPFLAKVRKRVSY